VSIWYPSDEVTSESEALTVLDYMEILKAEEEWEYLPNDHILNWFEYPNTPTNQAHLLEKTSAYAELKPAAGKFPAIVYAPGLQTSSIENFALCEYLASHGYIVISSPSRGTANRFFENEAGKNLETQARDIEFLIAELSKIPTANLDQIATMGFSFGGLANVLAQMRNDNIKAIVSLDGSIKYQYETLKSSPFFDIEKVDVPFIHFAQKDIPKEVMLADKIDPSLTNEFEFYDSLSHSQAYSLKFHNLTHSYFTSLRILFEPRDERQDKSDAEIMESYKWLSVYTLNFLEAFLKKEPEALRFIENSPADNGIREGLITVRAKKPQAHIFTFQDFNELAAKQDYKNMNDLYHLIHKDHPRLDLPEGNLNNLGLQLVFNPETSEQGILIFLLATQLYPESSNLFDSLAEAYLFIGDKENAIKSFEKALKLYPQNQNAIDRLRQLRPLH
jgi:dienelactone hydrolase